VNSLTPSKRYFRLIFGLKILSLTQTSQEEEAVRMVKKTFVFTCLFLMVISTELPEDGTDSKPVRGRLKYKLIDLKSDQTLAEGEIKVSELYRIDLGIPDEPDKVYFENHFVKINDEFIVGLSMYGKKYLEDFRGFGITLRKLNEKTFSWEWYNRVGEKMFEKRQGKGRMFVEFVKRKGYWVISSTRFSGDHTLRAKKMTNLFGTNWQCVIYDGSHVTWYDPALDRLHNDEGG